MSSAKSKKSIVFSILFLGVFASLPVLADGKKEPDFSRLANKLVLEEPQKKQFMLIMDEQYKKHKEEREALQRQRKMMLEKQREDTLSSLAGVLSEEQLAKFESHMERRKKKWKGKRKEHKHCH